MSEEEGGRPLLQELRGGAGEPPKSALARLIKLFRRKQINKHTINSNLIKTLLLVLVLKRGPEPSEVARSVIWTESESSFTRR